jgi:hypothetical protein
MFLEPLDTDEKINRNNNAMQAAVRLISIRAYFAANPTPTWMRGGVLLGDDRAAGNCFEMSAVAIHFCHEASFLSKVSRVCLVGVNGPGSMADHGFVMVADHTATAEIDDIRTIRKMAGADTSGLWIIDCWMNIACAANMYYGAILGKLYHWRSAGKVIVENAAQNADGNWAPTRGKTLQYESYIPNLVNSPLTYYNASKPSA